MVFEARKIKYEVTYFVNSVLANKTTGTVGVTWPWNAVIKSKLTHEPDLDVEAFNKIRILAG